MSDKDIDKNSKPKSSWVNALVGGGLFAIFLTFMFQLVNTAFQSYVEVSITPAVKMQYQAIENYQKDRAEFLKIFVKNYGAMRNEYYIFLDVCVQNSKIGEAFKEKNTQAINNLLNEGQNIRYYFGDGIRDIIVYELGWYKEHISLCPDTANLEKTKKNLMYRQNMLQHVINKHVFDPSLVDSEINAPYYQ